jgi:hypothetical protein
MDVWDRGDNNNITGYPPNGYAIYGEIAGIDGGNIFFL